MPGFFISNIFGKVSVFRKIPFLRILLPFATGVYAHLAFPHFIKPPFWIPLLIACGLLLVKTGVDRLNRLKLPFLMGADLFLVLTGASLGFYQTESNHPRHYPRHLNLDSSQTLVVEVVDLPIKRTTFTRIPVKVLAGEHKGQMHSLRGQVLAYVKNSAATESIEVGDQLVLHATLTEVQGPQNPGEFDYRQYLYYRNIYHTLFADSSSFRRLSVPGNTFSLRLAGIRCKQVILNRLRRSGLTQEAFAICAALITGYDDEIDRTVLQAFSHSGTLHVLSVSGLHVGLIYLMINFVFHRIDLRHRQKGLQLILTCVCLWGFAFIAGFAAPVLRAVLMFTFLGIGRFFFRTQSHDQLNILLFSAFVLVFINPFYLVDIGFLLSYLAVFGLIYFQPKFLKRWSPNSKVLRLIWENTCASFAATLSTLPLTLLFFHQFPLWFFVSNAVVVPLTFVVMLLSAGVLMQVSFLVPLTNGLVEILLRFINLFNKQGTAYWDNIDFSNCDAVFLTLVLLLFSIALQFRSYRYLRTAFLLLITWQLVSLYTSFRAKTSSEFTVYSIKKANVFACKTGTRVVLSPCTPAEKDYHIQGHLTALNYPGIEQKIFNYVQTTQGAIIVLNEKTSLSEAVIRNTSVLIISNNYRISEKELAAFERLKILVLAGNNSFKTAAHAEELSRKFKLDFYDVKKSGCFQLNLNKMKVYEVANR